MKIVSPIFEPTSSYIPHPHHHHHDFVLFLLFAVVVVVIVVVVCEMVSVVMMEVLQLLLLVTENWSKGLAVVMNSTEMVEDKVTVLLCLDRCCKYDSCYGSWTAVFGGGA